MIAVNPRFTLSNRRALLVCPVLCWWIARSGWLGWRRGASFMTILFFTPVSPPIYREISRKYQRINRSSETCWPYSRMESIIAFHWRENKREKYFSMMDNKDSSVCSYYVICAINKLSPSGKCPPRREIQNILEIKIESLIACE